MHVAPVCAILGGPGQVVVEVRGQAEASVFLWLLLMVLASAETFSAILTVEGSQQQGVGGVTLLTLSDTEDSLHFLLLFRGLLEPRNGGESSWVGRSRQQGRGWQGNGRKSSYPSLPQQGPQV